jgi:flagellar biosynthetic protein FliQ
MDSMQVTRLVHDFLLTGLLLITPAVLTSLLVGLVISIFQTVTSIQEQTLTFAPRIVAVGVVIALTWNWSMELLVNFSERLFVLLSGVPT